MVRFMNVKNEFVLKKLNEERIQYIYIGNINISVNINKMGGYKEKKAMNIMVPDMDNKKLYELMSGLGRKLFHPYSKLNDWNYLYDLNEFDIWRLKTHDDIFINRVNKLCINSLMPKTWVPFDNVIQNYAWKTRRFDEKRNTYVLDDNLRYAYIIARCIFDKKKFDLNDIQLICDIENKIDFTLVESFFSVVFFGFTPLLMEMIRKKEFDNVYHTYLKFIHY